VAGVVTVRYIYVCPCEQLTAIKSDRRQLDEHSVPESAAGITRAFTTNCAIPTTGVRHYRDANSYLLNRQACVTGDPPPNALNRLQIDNHRSGDHPSWGVRTRKTVSSDHNRPNHSEKICGYDPLSGFLCS
jgi:hypothetical protein